MPAEVYRKIHGVVDMVNDEGRNGRACTCGGDGELIYTLRMLVRRWRDHAPIIAAWISDPVVVINRAAEQLQAVIAGDADMLNALPAAGSLEAGDAPPVAIAAPPTHLNGRTTPNGIAAQHHTDSGDVRAQEHISPNEVANISEEDHNVDRLFRDIVASMQG